MTDDVVLLIERGDARMAQGDVSGALESYEARHAITERLAASDAGNAGWQRDLWVSLWRLREIPESGVTWGDIVTRMEAMQAKGTLLPTDVEFLETARAEAAAE